MDKLETAKQIADAACCLDWTKGIHPPQERDEMDRHVGILHDIAEQMAAAAAADERYRADVAAHLRTLSATQSAVDRKFGGAA